MSLSSKLLPLAAGAAILVSILAPIAPSARASTLTLDFAGDPSTLPDSAGSGTGFTTRMSGSGSAFTSNDPNLTLNTTNHTLSMLATNSKPKNLTNLTSGEFLGIKLSSLGFTGTQDFSVSATFTNIKYDDDLDQFGVIIGTAMNSSYRVGPGYDLSAGSDAQHSQFIYEGVHNNSNSELQEWYGNQPKDGDTITLTLSRTSNVYQLQIVDTMTAGVSKTINISTHSGSNPPNFLNSAGDLTVGVYATSGTDATPPTETLSAFSATVVPEPSMLATIGVIGLSYLAKRRR